jgi:hypothetical protein
MRRTAPRGGVNDEDLIESAVSVVAQGTGDAPVETSIDLGPTTLRFLEQGRESGQLLSIPDEFPDRDVDEVGQVVHRQLCRARPHRSGYEPRYRKVGRRGMDG